MNKGSCIFYKITMYTWYLELNCTYYNLGQGTMGLEVLDQVPDLDAIVIPVGGGGLIAGTDL